LEDSVPSLEEIKKGIKVSIIFSLLAISSWIWIYYNMNKIIEILVKNFWTILLILIIFVTVPSISLYFIANSLNKNVSFLRSLGANLLSYMVYFLVSLIIIFHPFPYMNQILEIFILFTSLLIAFIALYARIFHVNWIDAFRIASRYAFISTLIIIVVVFAIIFNLG
jgi:hypothetical protein